MKAAKVLEAIETSQAYRVCRSLFILFFWLLVFEFFIRNAIFSGIASFLSLRNFLVRMI